MIPQAARDVVVALLEKTRAGEAHWHKPRFSGDRHTSIRLGPYLLTLFATRHGAVVIRLENEGQGELVFSHPVLPDEPDFELVDELLGLADPGFPVRDGVLNDVRRLVTQAGPIG
jgi:hypothetical protein